MFEKKCKPKSGQIIELSVLNNKTVSTLKKVGGVFFIKYNDLV